MLGRIAAAIARVLATMGKDFWAALPAIGRGIDDVIGWPFRLLGGGGREAPSYTPEIAASDYTDVLRNARETAKTDAKKFDRNVMESVLEYCRAHPDARAVMKLPTNLDPRIQAQLLTMDDAALRALARGGASQLKRLIEGIPNDTAPTMSPHDHVLWKVRANTEKDAEPFVPQRAMSF